MNSIQEKHLDTSNRRSVFKVCHIIHKVVITIFLFHESLERASVQSAPNSLSAGEPSSVSHNTWLSPSNSDSHNLIIRFCKNCKSPFQWGNCR